jgi:hypothetical protein
MHAGLVDDRERGFPHGNQALVGCGSNPALRSSLRSRRRDPGQVGATPVAFWPSTTTLVLKRGGINLVPITVTADLSCMTRSTDLNLRSRRVGSRTSERCAIVRCPPPYQRRRCALTVIL